MAFSVINIILGRLSFNGSTIHIDPTYRAVQKVQTTTLVSCNTALAAKCIRFLKVNAKGEVFYVVPVQEKELSIFQVDKLKIFRVLNIIP